MTQRDARTNFFDLPQEVRDIIYTYWPKTAWIDVTQSYPCNTQTINREHDKSVLQPNISRVSKRMREESLAVFYGKNKFLIDLRGWKHPAYPKDWTPLTIVTRWIHAIGDENAARLRHLSFVSYSFSLHVAISYEDENPKIAVKLRPFDDNPKLAKNVPSGYSMAVAHSYAGQGMRWMLDEIESRRVGARRLTAADVVEICRNVERIRPFLCTRRSLGFRRAVLPSGDPGTWPTAKTHLKKCHVCGDGYVDRTKR
ncbi:hypothetical protein KC332_g621 [Hortaea werneckii]|uniref:Uncharacterized protein n=1 Tax=Hortaea werneckii TaxID=91943 RepID=A0A3M7IE62_HORWE|nr:hypothetical protein KC358_g15710 [Hortaea werneckii]KAI6802553.1 hypothetical protein KC350_g15418 [Hortaea werneckii]KAI6903611.1 hypothetical protein KC348_g15621 [Hortaea werneckii]KAI6922236.1 hypothetical protein KC341_g15498 [Hortaea werneckii]KAI6955601.1 hypothetical protein KC321_g15659 [Hortaea werneckii]